MQIKNPKAFLHIPKTAGTSLVLSLREEYGSVLTHYPPDAIEYNVHPKNADLFVGHYAFGFAETVFMGQKPFLFTFLRDPIKRFVSQLKFDVHYFSTSEIEQPCVLSDFSQDAINEYVVLNQAFYLDNCLVRYISGRWNYVPIGELTIEDLNLAKHNLKKFDFIGDANSYSEDLTKLGILLGTKFTEYKENVSEYNANSDAVEIDIIPPEKFVTFDTELYKYYLENFR